MNDVLKQFRIVFGIDTKPLVECKKQNPRLKDSGVYLIQSQRLILAIRLCKAL